MQFFVSCYGPTFAPYLAVVLRSLRDSHPGVRVTAMHDYGEPLVSRLAAANPDARLIYTTATHETERTKRIAAKLGFWCRFLDDLPDGEMAVFLDADMIVRGGLADFLADPFDVLITVQYDGRLNTGLMAIRASERSRALIRAWRERTESTCLDAVATVRAIKIGFAIDQGVLLQLMGYVDGGPLSLGASTIDTPIGPVDFRMTECSILNETQSVSLSAPALVLHFKGGWHKILIAGKRFTASRPRSRSAEMYQLWMSTLLAEEERLGLRLLAPYPRLKYWLRLPLLKKIATQRRVEALAVVRRSSGE